MALRVGKISSEEAKVVKVTSGNENRLKMSGLKKVDHEQEKMTAVKLIPRL